MKQAQEFVYEGKRVIDFDGDFRREPKTKLFCAVCQKDIKPDSKYEKFWFGGCCLAVHPDDVTQDDIIVYIGSECKKKLPKHYRLT